MIKRQLDVLGGSKVLTLDPFILEYLGLENSNEVVIRIESDAIVIKKSQSIDNISNSKQTVSESASLTKSQYIRDFFKDGRLSIGDELIYYPAIEENKASLKDKEIKAVIIKNANGNRYYLKSLADGQEYSLSGLRRKIIDEYNLRSVKRNWVYNINNEWKSLKTNRYLSEL